MKRIRLRVFLLVAWIIILSNFTRSFESLYFSPLTFIVALFMVLVALALPQINRVSLGVMLAIPVPLLIFSKVATESLEQNLNILLILIESLAIGLLILMAYWVNRAIREFENSVANIMIGQPEKSPIPYSMGQDILYREVRRARNHQRPLTIMSVVVDEKSIKSNLDRLAQEAQKNLLMQYTLAEVSKTLCNKLEDSDTVVLRNDQFLIVLPETKPEHCPGLMDRLQSQVMEQVGVSIKIGTASLPLDGYTLEGLIDKATQEICMTDEPCCMGDMELVKSSVLPVDSQQR